MPRDLSEPVEVSAEGEGLYQALISRLPERVRNGFSQEQLAALRDAARRCKRGSHPVDLRWNIPLLFKRCYLVVLAGPERRGEHRRMEEGRRYPRATLANLVFLACLAMGGTVFGGAVFALLFTWYLSV